jgi:hypothetical protein
VSLLTGRPFYGRIRRLVTAEQAIKKAKNAPQLPKTERENEVWQRHTLSEIYRSKREKNINSTRVIQQHFLLIIFSIHK